MVRRREGYASKLFPVKRKAAADPTIQATYNLSCICQAPFRERPFRVLTYIIAEIMFVRYGISILS
jgi:hypothetical protein